MEIDISTVLLEKISSQATGKYKHDNSVVAGGWIGENGVV